MWCRCVFGQVYFSSLPLGIYLLMIGQLWLGVVLVSLVPSTLLLLVLYGFCQCLCHELMEALAARTHAAVTTTRTQRHITAPVTTPEPRRSSWNNDTQQ